MVVIAGATVARDATGNVADMVNGSFAFLNCTGSKYIQTHTHTQKIS